MTNRPKQAGARELAVWGGAAFACGLVCGWMDRSSGGVQATVVVLMLASFALTLPGHAPVWLVAVAVAAGLPVMHALAGDPVHAAMLVAVVPALVAAAGGWAAGMLLGSAAESLGVPKTALAMPWTHRPLSKRSLLALALVATAAAGFGPVAAILRDAGHPLAIWLALVWVAATLVGWIVATPLILAAWRRRASGASAPAAGGVAPLELASHLGIVALLVVLHAALLVSLTRVLFIPPGPGWLALARAAGLAFLPVDLLAYLSIVALGWASDAERHRHDAEQRERALDAEVLDGRLAALRARLNPHFLFNALNSVSVLSQAGRTDDTQRLIEGLSALLRYVLDERSAMVPLAEELAFARRYLDVQQVRFGERLRFDVVAGETASGALVPQLVLQPIVENAVEHGITQAAGGGMVTVTATRAADELVLVVDDTGPGPSPSPAAGIGLSNTRERLDRLYGGAARLTLGPLAGGGSRVEIRIPFHAEPVAGAARQRA